MRILLVTHAVGKGSMATYTARVAKGLPAEVEADIYNNGRLYSGEKSYQLLLDDLSGNKSWKRSSAWIKYWKDIKRLEQSYDIIHICTQRFSFLANTMKYVVTYHDIFPFQSFTSFNMERIYNARLGDRIRNYYFATSSRRNARRRVRAIAVSNVTRLAIRQNFNFEEDIIRTIPSPIDMPSIVMNKREAKVALGIPPDTRVLLFVGTDEPRKNSILKYKLASDLPERTMLVNVGPFDISEIATEHRQRLRKMIDIKDEELSTAYYASDIFISPSFEEGFDAPVVEALVHGTVPLISDIPVHREIAGRWGTFFDPFDYGDFLQQLNKILEEPKIYEQFTRIRDIYCETSKVGRAIAEYYKSIMEDNKP